MLKESIQLSSLSTALSNPQTWQENCLFAVQNCVHEWRHILSFHQNQLPEIQQGVNFSPGQDSDDDDDYHDYHDDLDQEQEQDLVTKTNKTPKSPTRNHDDIDEKQHQLRVDIQTTALKLFGLIQMAMQVGPLKGSNPGYFKRCGVDVAKMAQQFLNECVYGKDDNLNDDQNKALGDVNCSSNKIETIEKNREGDEGELRLQPQPQPQPHILISQLRFTEKQKNVITKWMSNADKAVKANKLPSKSALKLQQSSKSKKSQKKMSNLKKKKKK